MPLTEISTAFYGPSMRRLPDKSLRYATSAMLQVYQENDIIETAMPLENDNIAFQIVSK